MGIFDAEEERLQQIVWRAASDAASAHSRALLDAVMETRREIAEVRAMVDALGEALAKTGAVDPAFVRERFDARLKDLLAPPADWPIPTGGEVAAGPYRGATAPSLVTCVVCQREFKGSETFLAPEGLMCRPCYAKAKRGES